MSKHEAKQPKVPTFPPAAKVTYDLLNAIVNEDSERSPMAYGALTRLSSLWTQCTFAGETPLGAGCRVEVVQDLVNAMFTLFPNGEGLPGRDGL
jgi:hypothetical protein